MFAEGAMYAKRECEQSGIAPCIERLNEHRLTAWGKRLYKRRKETVERSFADAKQLHGHRYARMRGIDKVREQCLLAAACQNMKKMALMRWQAFLRDLNAAYRLLKRITNAQKATVFNAPVKWLA